MQSGGALGPPECTSSGENGPWVAHYPGNSPVNGGLIGVFIAIALLWAAAPAVISGFIASARGQNVGLAVVLGLFLGWIGLLIVLVAFKQRVSAEAPSLIAETVGSRPSRSAAMPPRTTSARIAELDDLKQQGLITPDEYASRRQAILDQI